MAHHSHELKLFDFIEEIETKYIQNFWMASNIGIDPANDHHGYNWTDDYEDKVNSIDSTLFTEN